jgi:hypothetical protein
MKMRNREKNGDEKENRDENNSEPEHHELTLVLAGRRR